MIAMSYNKNIFSFKEPPYCLPKFLCNFVSHQYMRVLIASHLIIIIVVINYNTKTNIYGHWYNRQIKVTTGDYDNFLMIFF